MIEIKQICITTDFSENAAAAIPYGVELAKRFDARVWLVHVFDGTYLYDAAQEAGEGHFPNPAHWIDPLYHRLDVRLTADAKKYTATMGIGFTPVLLKGNTVAEISNFLKREHIGCLVISTHGRTGLAHVLFGSMAERLVRSSPCPVFSIKCHLQTEAPVS